MPGFWWQQREIRQLTEWIRNGELVETFTIGGRSRFAIRWKARRLRLVPTSAARSPWRVREVRALRKLRRQGLGSRAIATAGLLPGRSANGIAKKFHRLGLVDPERARRARLGVENRFRGLVRARFHDFLRAHAATCTPEQIALRWNRQERRKVNRHRVVYHLTVLGLKHPWSVVIRMPYSRMKRRAGQIRGRAVRDRQWEAWRAAQVAAFEARAAELRLQPPRNGRVPERTCRLCGKTWPEVSPFFLQQQRWWNGVLRRTLTRICRFCYTRERRECRAARPPARSRIPSVTSPA